MSKIHLGGTERYGNAIITFSAWARFHLNGKYVWMSFHHYCGPEFYTDSAMTKLYPMSTDEDENGYNLDPIWKPFGIWFEKYQKAKAKREAQSMKKLKEKS
jgi:hypothetical protein